MLGEPRRVENEGKTDRNGGEIGEKKQQRAGLVCVRQECGEGGLEAREAGQGCAPPLWNAL